MKRGDFLGHIGWTGAGIAYALTAGGLVRAADTTPDGPYFIQISDSHLGFRLAPNPDVAGTLKQTIDAINALPNQPKFVIHTGDVTHLSKPEQFDLGKQLLATLKAPTIVNPGEHDALQGGLKPFYTNFPAKSGTDGWFSWDAQDVHYVVLVNVFDFQQMGKLGNDQLAWLQRDLAGLPKSRPIVIFAHVPLYALYPKWGWTTEDGSNALAILAGFDAVTVLNGHIHQVIEHTEGNIHFASANATAFPLAAPSTAPNPTPLTLPPNQLLHAIGYRTVSMSGGHAATHDVTLG